MNQFKCRHCDLSAHFYFRESEGGMLCPDHSDLHCAAHVRDMMERSRLDKSSSPESLSGECAAAGVSAGAPAFVAAANSPPTVLSPPVAGALADTPLPVTAGAALSVIKYVTTFRVAASSLIHESSDIPNHHQ